MHRPLPVRVEPSGLPVEEDEASQVRWPLRVGEDLRVERVAESVGGEDVEAAVADERGGFGHGVEEALDAGPDPLNYGLAAGGALLGSADEVEEMGPFDLVELQGAGDGVKDVF